MNIEKRLKLWQDAGLLQQDQVEGILRFEQEKPSASWVLYGVVGLGVLVVLTGIVSIIAANWDFFSASTKLAAYFILLLALGFFTLQRVEQIGILREALLTGFALFVLAGIGLISQIYHLRGDGWQAIYFWLAIIFPLCLFAQSRLLPNLWFLGFSYATLLWSEVLSTNSIFVVIALPYLFLAFGYGLAHLVSTQFCAAARLWSYGILLFPLAIMATIAWGDQASHFSRSTWELESGALRFLPWISLLIALIAVFFRKIQNGKSLSVAIAATLGVTGIFIIPGLTDLRIQDQSFIGCVLFIFSWAGAAWIAAALQRKRLFDLATSVIGIRFIVVYFEVFGSLAATGIGLIISGFVILGVAWLWHQYRRKIAKFIQEGI